MGRVLFSLLIFASTNVWAAAPVISGISGASNYVLTGTPTVYGGLAGNDCSGTGASTSLCNSCTAAVADSAPACPQQSLLVLPATSYLCGCNTTRIHDTAILTITVKTAGTGNLVFDSTDAGVTPVIGTGSSVPVPWSVICGGNCDAITDQITNVSGRLCFDSDNNGNCTSGENSTFTIKIIKPDAAYDIWDDAAGNADGIGGFKAFPGDEKIYIDDPVSPAGFPTLSYGSKVTKVRVFISTVDMTKANFAEGDLEPEDLTLTNDSLDNSLVDGLDNGTPYVLRLGMVDEANNVVQFFPNGDNNDAVQLLCNTVSPPDPDQCPYAATPDQVLGMLTEDINCFIATAAYGTLLEPKLDTFRKFRYQVLLRHKWGVKFVKAYYHYGPFAARFIKDKPLLRLATQAALWPLYGFSWLTLKIGLVKATAVASLLISALLFLPWLGIGDRRGRG